MNTNFACGLTVICPDDEAFSGYQKYIDAYDSVSCHSLPHIGS
jgi:hypothetical protein